MRNLIVLITTAAILAPMALGRRPEKKLIEFGWDEPSTKFLRENIAEMEKMPFDGVVFNVHYKNAAGADSVLEWTGFGPPGIRFEWLLPAIVDLKATPFHRFTDNFVRFNTTPAKVDWFDNFAAIVHNARMAGFIVKQAHIKGILFDIEQYEGQCFDYKKQALHDQKTFDEYAEQVRKRGREIMEAFQSEAPGLTVFLTFGYPLAGKTRAELPDRSYGLLAPFLDGMFEAAKGSSSIIDGFEFSYPYREPEQFGSAYRWMHEESLAVCSVPEQYRKHLSAGFGIWLDEDWRAKGWNTEDVSKNWFNPAAFETAMTAALKRSDRYVWLYTEQPRWWPREKLPEPYIQAVRKARNANGMRNP